MVVPLATAVPWAGAVATATEAQATAVRLASSPYGILSILLIMFVGGGLYFFVLPRCVCAAGQQKAAAPQT